MNLHNRPSVLSSAAILILLISLTADPRTACADEPETPNEMEEVTVYGEKSLLNLKRALIESEDNAFEVFNSFNKDYQYDIRCYKTKPLGSQIPRRTCYPNYIDTLENEAADRARGSKRWLNMGQMIVSIPKQRKMEKNLREIMNALKLEHPELAEALNTYSEAKHRYVTASEEK